jgi:hypothetical protein
MDESKFTCKKGTNYESTMRVIMAKICSALEVYITDTNSDYPSVGCKAKSSIVLSQEQIVTLGLEAYSKRIIY